jgi:serine phosphatase RsbU (regulator of sigma subunit)
VRGRGRAPKQDARTGGRPGSPPRLSRFALALAAILFLVSFQLPRVEFFEILELKTQDLRLQTRGARPVHDDLVVIEFEQHSLDAYDDSWPIARNQYALLLRALEEWGAKVIGFDLWFGGPDKYDPENDVFLAAVSGLTPQAFHVVYLPLRFPDGSLRGVGRSAGPDSLLDRYFPRASAAHAFLMESQQGKIDLPDVLLESVDVLGHIALATDDDGVARRIPLLVRHEGRLVPSLSLLMAARYLEVDWKTARFTGGGVSDWRTLHMAGAGRELAVPVDRYGRVIINFPGTEKRFPHRYAFIDVVNSAGHHVSADAIPAGLPQPAEFAGKIVLVCNTAISSASADFGPTPFAANFPLAYAHASAVNSMVRGDYVRGLPRWAEALAYAVLALGLAVALPGLAPAALGVTAAALILGLAAVAWIGLLLGSVMVPLVQPLFLTSGIAVGVLLRGYVLKERQRLAVEQELSVARRIQQDLLPRAPLAEGVVEVTGVNLPCHAVGGDYFDYFRLADGQLAVAIGDVSGKGIPAALLMSNLQATLRGECSHGAEVTKVVEHANRLLMDSMEGSSKFITFFFATVDPATRRLRYTNAGHNPPLLVRRDGALEKLETGGLLLGIFPLATYDAGEVQLEPGDAVVLFTDGVTEAEDRGKNQFTDERLERLVGEIHHLSAGEIRDRVCQAVLRFSAGIHAVDDTTVVVVKVAEAA